MDHNPNMTMAKLIVPILRDYAVNRHGIPGTFIETMGYTGMVPESENDHVSEVWDATIEQMIAAFELIANDHYRDGSGNELPEVRAGLTFFAEYFNNLWS